MLGAGLAAAGLVLAAAPDPAPPDRGEGPDPLLEYLTRAVRDERFRGAVEVRRGAEVLLRRGFDHADVAGAVRNGPDTRFHLASLTKQFTGLAVLVLQEQGRLRVTDPACARLPHCPPHWRPITIEHLLTHTSGLYNYTDDLAGLEQRLGKGRVSPADLVATVADRPLEFTPGSRYAYGNSGYAVLGHIVEHVTGQSYGDFLRREVLDPLGMADSGYRPDLAPGPGYALAYADWTTPAPTFSESIAFAAGGMYSTVTDLGRWQRFLLTGSPAVVEPGTLAELLRPRVAMGPQEWYGYGIVSRGTVSRGTAGSGTGTGGRVVVDSHHHDGNVPGVATYLEVRPDTGVSVTVLANITTDAAGIGRDLAALATGVPDGAAGR
jgi:CubicO group peptidase (beta-lactamase class C family)